MSTFYDFCKADDESILGVLYFHFGNYANSTESVTDLWIKFKGIVSISIERFAPSIRTRPRKRYLYVLLSRSLRHGELPHDWVTAKIKTMYKNGNKYRGGRIEKF